MRLLLDTHTFLWFVWGSPQLPTTTASLITSPANEVYLSMASVWEMAIKVRLGKLVLSRPVGAFLSEQLDAAALLILPITFDHATHVSVLPLHHRDPFDRLLAAQSLIEQLTLVSVDTLFDAYEVRRVW